MPIKLALDDLLIRDASLDYTGLLHDWRWLIGGRFRVVAGSKFGDWFLERPGRSIELLDAMEGQIQEVAPSEHEFQRLLNTRERQEEWLLSQLVLTLHEKGMIPARGECYAFKVPPLLGGKVESGNVEIMDLQVWTSLCGQLHQQVQALPPGTKISAFKLEGE